MQHADSTPDRLLCSSLTLYRLAAGCGVAAGCGLAAGRRLAADCGSPADSPLVIHCPFGPVLHRRNAKAGRLPFYILWARCFRSGNTQCFDGNMCGRPNDSSVTARHDVRI